MFGVSYSGGGAALSLFQPGRGGQKPSFNFINTDKKTLNVIGFAKEIAAAMEDPILARAFAAEVKRAKQTRGGVSDQNAKHIALVEVVTKNRSKFPAGGFTIRTDFGNGASIATEIPARKRGYF